MIWIILVIVAIIIALLFVPVKINITFQMKKKDITAPLEKGINKIEVYLFHWIKIAKINLNVKNKKNNTKAIVKKKAKIKVEYVRALIEKVYVHKLYLKLSYNLQDIFANTFAMAVINSAINMLLVYKSDKMNFKMVDYTTNISNNLFFLDFKSIIKFSLANTIRVIIKVMIDMRKVEKENGRTASNRKFNDDSYDVA